jgi:hypothetical protein
MKPVGISLANGISFLGHPLILGTAYVAWMSFTFLNRQQAWYITLAVMLILTIPISIHNWRKTKSGSYSNFDVSDQKQRRAFYPIALGLLLVLVLTLWLMEVPKQVMIHTLLVGGMVGLMAWVNTRTKASLHAAIAMFIAINCYTLGAWPGIGMTVFALSIAWSRCAMGRHTFIEILLGLAFGLFFGLLAVRV